MGVRKGRTSRCRRWAKKNSTDHLEINNQSIYELLKWMKKFGFQPASKLKVYNFPETGRGLLALQAIDANQTILSVPEALIITCDIPRKMSEFKEFLQNRSNDYFTEEELLTIFVAYEWTKGSQSVWWTYLSTLPKNQLTLANISEDHLDHLPQCYGLMVKKEISNIKNSYLKAGPLITQLERINPSGRVNYELFHWSWNIVNSRCVSLNLKPSNTESCTNEFEKPTFNHCTIALVPYLDLLNHSSKTRVSASFNVQSNTFDIVTLKKIKKHEQAFIHYGFHDNRKLLLHYGFILQENPNNWVPVTIDDFSIIKTCHSSCLKIKLQHAQDHLTGCGFNEEGISWSLQAVIHLLKSQCVYKRGLNSSLFDTFSEGNMDITEEEKNYVQQVLDEKLHQYNKFVDHFSITSSNTLIELVKNLLDLEKRLTKNVQAKLRFS